LSSLNCAVQDICNGHICNWKHLTAMLMEEHAWMSPFRVPPTLLLSGLSWLSNSWHFFYFGSAVNNFFKAAANDWRDEWLLWHPNGSVGPPNPLPLLKACQHFPLSAFGGIQKSLQCNESLSNAWLTAILPHSPVWDSHQWHFFSWTLPMHPAQPQFDFPSFHILVVLPSPLPPPPWNPTSAPAVVQRRRWPPTSLILLTTNHF